LLSYLQEPCTLAPPADAAPAVMFRNGVRPTVEGVEDARAAVFNALHALKA
jgi:hypothetical protein